MGGVMQEQDKQLFFMIIGKLYFEKQQLEHLAKAEIQKLKTQLDANAKNTK
jgi:ribosomal protein L1